MIIEHTYSSGTPAGILVVLGTGSIALLCYCTVSTRVPKLLAHSCTEDIEIWVSWLNTSTTFGQSTESWFSWSVLIISRRLSKRLLLNMGWSLKILVLCDSSRFYKRQAIGSTVQYSSTVLVLEYALADCQRIAGRARVVSKAGLGTDENASVIARSC